MRTRARRYASNGQMGGVSTREAADRAGVTYRQLDYWVRTHRVRPTSGYASLRGAGNYVWWTEDDIIDLMAIVDRLAWGMTLDAALRSHDPPKPPPPSGQLTPNPQNGDA